MLLYDEPTLDALREQTSKYLELVCSVTNLRHPFRCLHPDHEDKKPSMSFDTRTQRVHCFSCGVDEDVFEVAGWVEGATRFPDKVEAVARAVGYFLPTSPQVTTRKPHVRPKKPAYAKPKQIVGVDLTDQMLEARRVLLEEPQGQAALDYLRSRGFNDELITHAPIGYVKHPSVLFPNMKAPQCDDGYLALGFPVPVEDMSAQIEGDAFRITVPYVTFRAYSDEAAPKELKPPNLTSPLWREHLLDVGLYNPSRPIYVVEGIFDALSLITLLGVRAVALCGTGTTRFLEVITHAPKKYRPKLVLAFDSDEAGARYTETVSDKLKKLNIPYSIAKPYPYGCKDANEWLMLKGGSHG
ncbi:MAG: toprim domain-containing protein [Coriobacteriia bacterium]|nr:toprim domain-containing protein [Coriobacteriia bacterium]